MENSLGVNSDFLERTSFRNEIVTAGNLSLYSTLSNITIAWLKDTSKQTFFLIYKKKFFFFIILLKKIN
jgi:hypothetical protein